MNNCDLLDFYLTILEENSDEIEKKYREKGIDLEKIRQRLLQKLEEAYEKVIEQRQDQQG